MRIEITAEDDSGLQREVYQFVVSIPGGWGSLKVYFDSYVRQSRKTKRHRNWDVHAFWARHPSPSAARTMIDKPRIPAAVEVRMKQELSQRTEYEL